ncbi:acetylornithine transaminase [Viridibacillus sp. FSL R5-0468]|uniref:acetylornithine transaminase n=1 Tax=Viridibacillus sp. FSL R5-0468 TaxID=2921640 RepID=UPI0030F73ED3
MSALFGNYSRRPVHLVKGLGTKVYDEAGKEYLDFTSGIAVLSLGHANPILVEAIKVQSEKLWHISNLFESPEQEQLAATLLKDTHLAHGFFCNSGAEANEAAIKLARKHTGKHTIITFENSFHGRTFGAMSATGQAKVQQGFGPLVNKFIHVPFNDVKALEAVVNDEVAAIMLEVVQGEGGVNSVSEEFGEAITKISKEQGILLIIDEVQTGISRTGTRYAYEQTALKPDILTLAKGLGGGFPIGAMLGTSEMYDTFSPGTHGTTFGGNPLAVAVAQTVLNHVFEESFLGEVLKKSEYFTKQLEKTLPAEKFTVKGMGLLLGVDCGKAVAPFITKAEDAGLLLVGAGEEVIRLLPPLTVTHEEIDAAIAILADIIND